jgi:long-chain fatty acid transport protein
MRSTRLHYFAIVSLAMVSLLICRPARGGGIEVPMQDAKAAGEADAFTAQADDPSAIFYNPAGLTQLHGTNASAGAYLLFPEFHVSGPAGNESMSLMSILPHFYAESDFGTKNWRFGIGGVNEFGINEDWGNQGQVAPLVDKAQLAVLNLAPTAAYQVNEHLSVGAALNIYYGTLYLQRNVIFGGGLPPGTFHFRGDDFALGFTPSIMYKIDDRSSIGAYYRSPFSLHFDGRAQVTSTVIPEIGPSPAHATLNFPESAGIGYSYKPIEPLTLEADIIWTDWHAVDQLSLQSAKRFHLSRRLAI